MYRFFPLVAVALATLPNALAQTPAETPQIEQPLLGRGSVATIMQAGGSGNRAEIRQSGEGGVATILQGGVGPANDSAAFVSQLGARAFAEIVQVGDRNRIDLAQTGDGAQASLGQAGDDNTMSIDQPTAGQVEINQFGIGNDVAYVQGIGALPIVITQTDGGPPVVVTNGVP